MQGLLVSKNARGFVVGDEDAVPSKLLRLGTWRAQIFPFCKHRALIVRVWRPADGDVHVRSPAVADSPSHSRHSTSAGSNNAQSNANASADAECEMVAVCVFSEQLVMPRFGELPLISIDQDCATVYGNVKLNADHDHDEGKPGKPQIERPVPLFALSVYE